MIQAITLFILSNQTVRKRDFAVLGLLCNALRWEVKEHKVAKENKSIIVILLLEISTYLCYTLKCDMIR